MALRRAGLSWLSRPCSSEYELTFARSGGVSQTAPSFAQALSVLAGVLTDFVTHPPDEG
jgi:hypothetical protein